jgi:hypothetical protein
MGIRGRAGSTATGNGAEWANINFQLGVEVQFLGFPQVMSCQDGVHAVSPGNGV